MPCQHRPHQRSLMPTEMAARPTDTRILAVHPAGKSLIYDEAEPVHGLGPAGDGQVPFRLERLAPLGARGRRPRRWNDSEPTRGAAICTVHALDRNHRKSGYEHTGPSGLVVTPAGLRCAVCLRRCLAARPVVGGSPCQSLLPLVAQRILPLRLAQLIRSPSLAAVVVAVALPGVAAPAHLERRPAPLTPKLPDPIHEAAHGTPSWTQPPPAGTSSTSLKRSRADSVSRARSSHSELSPSGYPPSSLLGHPLAVIQRPGVDSFS